MWVKEASRKIESCWYKDKILIIKRARYGSDSSELDFKVSFFGRESIDPSIY